MNIHSECDALPWSDVEKAASKMFHVWVDGGELEWARECWNHFARRGLTRSATVLEMTAACLRLVALARIYEEFCGLKWDENAETPVCDLADNLDIDSVALGVLAAPAIDDDISEADDDFELRATALLAATDKMRREIFTCLVHGYGDAVKLYSRMSKTNHPSKILDADDRMDEFEVTGPNSSAFSFVTNGFLQ
jgi:hypothetical protein